MENQKNGKYKNTLYVLYSFMLTVGWLKLISGLGELVGRERSGSLVFIQIGIALTSLFCHPTARLTSLWCGIWFGSFGGSQFPFLSSLLLVATQAMCLSRRFNIFKKFLAALRDNIMPYILQQIPVWNAERLAVKAGHTNSSVVLCKHQSRVNTEA